MGGGKMNVLIVIIVLAALGLLGVVTKSILAVLVGAVGLVASFLVFCTGTLFGILGHVIAFVISIAALTAIIIFIPALLLVIIPGIFLAFLYVRKKSYPATFRNVQRSKTVV